MRLKKYINTENEALSAWIEDIKDNFNRGGEVIYDSRNLIKVFNGLDRFPVNVKRYHTPKGINALIYSLGIRKPKGLRALQYAKVLNDSNIRTPQPLAYVEERNAIGMLRQSYLITEQISYDFIMYDIGNAAPDEYESLALQLAAFAADMHEKGIMHKDFTPGNILVTVKSDVSDDEPRYGFTLVDINRMHFGTVTRDMACGNLCRLWGSKQFMLTMIHEYARLRGFDIAETERIFLKKRMHFWHRLSRHHEIKFPLEY